MLQRAASNAYSWWWASHIRTKQSKWLEQNLQDMADKVQYVLKLIEQDGDSFAKRAEMYYKRRPELIQFVEESYRAYRALAERYDHLSNELQNANHTLATVFPEQVQFSMDEEDEDANPRLPKKGPSGAVISKDIPKAPKDPIKDLKAIFSSASKKPKKGTKSSSANAVAKSGLSKPQALEEINKLQKEILGLQTEKEFVKTSYESGLTKYWKIEEQIKEKHERISQLQDEFGAGTIIEDDEARSLMAAAALKSCQDTLAQLQEKQVKTAEDAITESKRIKDFQEKLMSLKNEYLHSQFDQEKSAEDVHMKSTDNVKRSDKELSSATQAIQDLELLQKKIREQLEAESNSSISVTQMADKIDELANKVINLETAVSSQTAVVSRLRAENDDLQMQIKNLEDDKESLISDAGKMSKKVKEMEEKFNGIQELNKNVEDQNITVQTSFTEAQCKLEHLSEKLDSVKLDEELEISGQSLKEQLPLETPIKEKKEQEDGHNHNGVQSSKVDRKHRITGATLVTEVETEGEKKGQVDAALSDSAGKELQNVKPEKEQASSKTTEDEPDWRHLFMNVKKKLDEVEKKNEDSITDKEIRELKSANYMKDEEIHSLRRKLSLMQRLLDENKDVKVLNPPVDQQKSTLLSLLTRSPPGGEEEFPPVEQSRSASPVEEKFRMRIDELLEQNLDFWLNFSTSFNHIQKFDTEVQDLQAELSKIEEKEKKQEGSSSPRYNLKSDARPIFKHLREIHTELSVWLEKSNLLKDELKSRFSSLCDIQEEITKALKESAEDDDFTFTSYQAAKFQGEILNMKQENNKVADELQAGLDHVTALQIEVEKTLAKLNEEFKLSGSKKESSPQMTHSESRARVPLRSFIFGVKQKKQKPSIFACVSPVLHKKYNAKTPGPL